MKGIRKGLILLGMLAGFLSFGNCEEAKAAGDGTAVNPYSTNGKSIEKYIFDKYKSKAAIADAYKQYKAYQKKNDNAPWYIRITDDKNAAELSKEDLTVKKDKHDNEVYKDELYVCWISYIKRAKTSSTGVLAECCNEDAKNREKPHDIGSGDDIYYNSFGFGIREDKYTDSYSKAKTLGENANCFVWYDGVLNKSTKKMEPVNYTRRKSGTEQSADISSFWVHSSGGEMGYCVYYIRYSTLYKAVEDYNASVDEKNKIEPTQSDSDAAMGGQKYARYDLWLNGATSLYAGSSFYKMSGGWQKIARTFATNYKYLEHLSNNKADEYYAECNYNIHVKLHILNCIPIVVRAWDITTNKCVSIDGDYYLQAFDSDVKGVDETDGVYWDLSSTSHNTDVQQALMKFMYTDTKTGEGSDTSNRARVAYQIDGGDYKSLELKSFVKRVNMGVIKPGSGDDGHAVLYFPKYDDMTEVKGIETADAYAPIGIRIFTYSGEDREKGITRDALVKKDYAQLRKYDPISQAEAINENFDYPPDTDVKSRVLSYCYKVGNIKAGKKDIRALNFDIRKDVQTAEGKLKHTTKMQWPTGNLRYDSSKKQHTDTYEWVQADRFFTRYCLSSNVATLKNKKLWWTADGTRYVYKDQKSVGAGQVEKIKANGRTARTSIKEVAEALGAKESEFEFKMPKNFYGDNPACVVIDILVSEMYYEQQSYNIEQLAVTDNKYDTEHGVWGYVGSRKATLKGKTADSEEKKDLPSLVHTEADDSKYGGTVSALDTLKETTNDYLRFDISKYGKKEQTGKDGSSDGVIYTLEGWSHYISPSNLGKDAENLGYTDSIQAGTSYNDKKFALYSSEWYTYLDSFGDDDDDFTDRRISNKIAAKSKNLVIDSWTYNLFYVIKPPIVGIVYVYDDRGAYKVQHVSAKSYKTFGTENIDTAKKKAANEQLKSKGCTTDAGASKNYILYDAGYHRAGDRVTVEIAGNHYFRKWTEQELVGFSSDAEGKRHPIYRTIYNVKCSDLAGAYITNAKVDFYDDSTDLPKVGSKSVKITDYSDPWNSAALYNYMGNNIGVAQNKGDTSYEYLDANYATYNQAKPRSDVSYTFDMPETTTAIVAVYGGPAQAAAKRNFKMRVQYLQYDGTKYNEISVDQISEKGTGDTMELVPDIDIEGNILDIGYTEFKQDNAPLSREYYQKPTADWGQPKDRSYTLKANQNRLVVYVVLDKPQNTTQWVTVVYLDAGEQEIPNDGSTVTLDYEYSYAEQFEGYGKIMVGLNGKDTDWVGVAYGVDLPKYDQVVNVDNVPTLMNPKPDMGKDTAWSLSFQGTARKNSNTTYTFGKPNATKDAAGRSISWSRKGKATYDAGGGKGRGCVIYVLTSQQYEPALPDRTKVEVIKKVEPLEPHTIDWEKAVKATVDGTTNLSAADYDTHISRDSDGMKVSLANDELNSTRDAFDPLISIPTSEFVKQYAKVKKYLTEWQYEKVTITWKFTDITRVYHQDCVGGCYNTSPKHSCCGHCSHYNVGSPYEHDTSATTTRYTTFYRVKYGDVYVPKDVTTFNKSFGTFGTDIYNKTLDQFGHATMLVKNDAYQNASLGFHMLSNADVQYPEFDESKLFPWDMRPHRKNHDCDGGPHWVYTSSTRENKPACKARLELACGKQNLYVSANEVWSFGDGEGNFTELSNSDLNHDNEMVHNYIDDPPEAKFTIAEGVPYSSTGTADKTKTYSEGSGYAKGISPDQFYQNAIPIPADTLDALYESRAFVHWQLHAQAKPHETEQHRIMRIEADSNIIFTPTVTLNCAVVDETAVQRIDQNGSVNFTMDNVFRLRIDATGENCNSLVYPGYGYDNYDRYLNKDVVDDKLQHVGYVKFPFPVIKKALVNGETIDTYYKEGTWIACAIGETEFIPAYYKDEMEMAQVQFMNRAENVLKKNSFTYEAPGTSMQQIHDSDNVDDMVQDDLMNGSIPDWDRISYPITNGASIDSVGVHGTYIATDVADCNLYGRIYGFSIIDQTDYPSWKGTFRNADGTLSMTKYTSGKNDRERWLRQTDALLTMPTVKGSNKQFTTAGVLKPGYAIRYTFETVGNMFNDSDYVEITPEFYWVYNNGQMSDPVDVYYKEQSSANSTVNLIRVGSEADQKNKKVLSMESFGFDHDYNYYTESSIAGSDTGNVKNENGDVDSAGNRLKYSLVQDTTKDNLVHAGEILGYKNLQEYLEHKEEVWYPSLTKLVNRMQTYDGLRHETILSNGSGDPFSALKSAVILNSGVLGVSREDMYKRIQEWYGEFYLPSNVYVTWEGTDVASYLTGSDGGMVLTGKEKCWLNNGYLAVKFNIVTYRNGTRWLSYDNSDTVDDNIRYDVGDMWEREGFATNRTDSNGTTFTLEEGTTVLYQIGYPDGGDGPGGDGGPGGNPNPSAAGDYEGAGTH